MGKNAVEICQVFHSRLGVMARELTRELYPDGLPRDTKFSEREAVTGALGDEMARQRIEINVQEQAESGSVPGSPRPARKAAGMGDLRRRHGKPTRSSA